MSYYPTKKVSAAWRQRCKDRADLNAERALSMLRAGMGHDEIRQSLGVTRDYVRVLIRRGKRIEQEQG